ncbi:MULTISPECIES: ABC-F family ATP-binding cassette domain-containing protein [Chitinophaga]|uniref:ABC-F family ATP-binding cassette domain-containing protein n=1 Tax=Chitinophaga TaxID=79328 RepID=UPI000DB9D7B0|nr:ABC-F family ATP-binding cassette domain-containing protein [Chitinophaga ginsengisegetis]MDR6568019.1 ATPase subunit of ABC transporter with duplicated ATPase domains [Chitinophaga ginsengisegetis]MDR6647426.1 ATPase subunit of ABC transporter with duplicated ATPase domains [Chitinophaga ginsengisegetis]MDR6653776.1 ATPase subunit of ABC transporter with duplicated ATPase domains [Chitinophaga ginsengisegetis]
MLISAQQLSYQLPSGQYLFQDVSFTLHKGYRAAIAGPNGAGKSTLLKIIAGQETASSGTIRATGPCYYVPQHFGHFNSLTVAEAAGTAQKLNALELILQGETSPHLYDVLGDDWDIAARSEAAFEKWGLRALQPDQPLSTLSGGEKTRLFLAGIDIFEPSVVLLDEPTNHLDYHAREQLYEWMAATSCTLLIVSHDRQLLRLCEPIWELQPNGIKTYGGNYDFYAAQKAVEADALQQRVAHQEKTLKEAKKQRQEAIERKQHADAQARKQAKTGGIPKILLNGRKNNAEVSTAKLKQVHTEKVEELRAGWQELSAMTQIQRMMKGYFEQSTLHTGKVLVQANGVNFGWPAAQPELPAPDHQPSNEPTRLASPENMLWKTPLTFTIRSGQRLAITGPNGSGKSTLLQLILGKLAPSTGELYTADTRSLLLDQDYTLIDRSKTVLQQALSYNNNLLEVSMVKTVLVNFLFGPDTWDKSCAVLSGGEMLRLALCSMTLQDKAPDMILLDEPTNNLDLQNIKILTQIFGEYKGTLLVISHDPDFIAEVGVDDVLALNT